MVGSGYAVYLNMVRQGLNNECNVDRSTQSSS